MEDGFVQVGPKVTIEVTIHDFMAQKWLRGVGRHYLWQISLEIFHQRCIYDPNLGGKVGFEFKTFYKLSILVH